MLVSGDRSGDRPGGAGCLLYFDKMAGGICFQRRLPDGGALLVTGGIHLDGFMDTTDARSSYGDREKKLAILKDSHVGAFAVIGCSFYLILSAGAGVK